MSDPSAPLNGVWTPGDDPSGPSEPVAPASGDRLDAGQEPGAVAVEPDDDRAVADPEPGSGRPVQDGRRAEDPEARQIPPLPRVIAIANQKGGVGKTTTAVNLGAALAELGFRTLVVDMDPQGNATTGLGIDPSSLEHTTYDVLIHSLPMEDCVEPTEVRNLFVAPASRDLSGAEVELVGMMSRETRLKRAIEGVLDDYDYVIVDCPPSLGLLTVNGLSAVKEIIVPIQCEYYALEGLALLTNNVELVKSHLNPDLDITGLVLVMYDGRTKLAEQVKEEVRGHFGSKVYRNAIPRNVRLSEAPSFGQPITVFDSSSRGAVAYRELAREVAGVS
jgi:chromosome partitioning protein